MGEAEVDLEVLSLVARREAAKRLTVSGGHEVDDVVQSAMADYLDYSARHEVENPSGLIRVMARFRAIKFRDRWEARRGDRVVDTVGGSDCDDLNDRIELAGLSESPASAFASRSRRERLAYAAGKLEPTDREIARLTYLNEPVLTAPEVAERLGLSAGTVRNHLVGIRRTLAALLDSAAG